MIKPTHLSSLRTTFTRCGTGQSPIFSNRDSKVPSLPRLRPALAFCLEDDYMIYDFEKTKVTINKYSSCYHRIAHIILSFSTSSRQGFPTSWHLCTMLKKRCLGPHIKYPVTRDHTRKSRNVLSKCMTCIGRTHSHIHCAGPWATGWTAEL